MWKLPAALCAAATCLAYPAGAQDVFVPPVTTASPGGFANPLQLDTDRYRREQRERRNDREHRADREQRVQADACSAESLPSREQIRIAEEYLRREQADGKVSADIWVREEGLRYRMSLVDQGICPSPDEAELAAVEEWREDNRRRTPAAAAAAARD